MMHALTSLFTLFIAYATLSAHAFTNTHSLHARFSKALLSKEFQKVTTKCYAKSFDSLEDRPPIPSKRRQVKEEGDDVWKKVKNNAFSTYDRLSAGSETEEQQQKKAASMTPGGRMMSQYKTTLEEKEESTVSVEPRPQSRWEKIKSGVYDSLDTFASSNSDSSTESQQTSPLDGGVGKLDPSNMKPFFPGAPPVTTKKENPLKRAINAITSTAEAIKNIPDQAKASVETVQALPGKIQKSYEETINTATNVVDKVQAIPEKVQKSYEETVNTATNVVDKVQAIPEKVQNSYEETVNTATNAVDKVQAIPEKVQKSYEETVNTATNVVGTVQAIPEKVQKSYELTVNTATNVVNTVQAIPEKVQKLSNTVSSTAQNIQRSVSSTKKNLEDMNARVKSLFPTKEEEKKREIEKGRRISNRVIAMPREKGSKKNNVNDVSNIKSPETKREVKEKQKSLFIDDIDKSLGEEVDMALKLAEAALASQKNVVKEENPVKKKKLSIPLFNLLWDDDE